MLLMIFAFVCLHVTLTFGADFPCHSVECGPGYTGFDCDEDIDECADEIAICGNGAACVNESPGFSCQCPDGWMGAVCNTPSDCTAVTTQISLGVIGGCQMASGVVAYRGIPYSDTRMNGDRYKRPSSPEAWNGTLDATTFKPDCLQIPLFGSGLYSPYNSEDCLYLNIWTPANAVNVSVLVWIFGGEFQTLGGSYLGDAPAVLAERHGIVVVTFSYRLGVFGFAPETNTRKNAAIYDQIKVLTFVKDHISAFNGDPSAVTLGGEGAGATAVALLAASFKSRTLFNQCIKIGGGWSQPKTCRDVFESRDALDLEIGDCNVTAIDRLWAAAQLPHFLLNLPFGPDCDDTSLFGGGAQGFSGLQVSIATTTPKTCITAYHVNEAAFFTAMDGVIDIGAHDFVATSSFTQEQLDALIVEIVQQTLDSLGSLISFSDEQVAVLVDVTNHFYNDPKGRHDSTRMDSQLRLVRAYTRLVQDFYYTAPSIAELFHDLVGLTRNKAIPQYLLVDMYVPDVQYPDGAPYTGATFMNMINLLFNRDTVFALGESSTDEKLHEHLMKYFATFVKFGTPWSVKNKREQPKTKKWAALTTPKRGFLKLDAKAKAGKKFANAAIEVYSTTVDRISNGDLNVDAMKKRVDKVLKTLDKFPI